MTAIPGATKKKQSAAQQIARCMSLLQKLPRERATESLFVELCSWIGELEPSQRPEILTSTLAAAFGKTIEEIDLVLRKADRRVEFDALVPETGYIRDYIEWTRNTEPPTVFHFFVAAVTLGATLGRAVSFDKGAYSVFPNLSVMIIAPSGKCRKTSACNLGTSIYVKGGGTLLADKATPEAFVDALKDGAQAIGLIYAPELAVFLGKQKYQEGMIPLLTALLDCPKEWTSRTLGRGETSLSNVALSALMCSTLDWMQTGIPRDAFGGGFMSRFLFCVQESTPRSFPLPPSLSEATKKALTLRMQKLRLRKGVCTFTPEAREWYLSWYGSRQSMSIDKQYAGYFERKPDHIIRVAMILKVSEMPTASQDYTLSLDHLQRANDILGWLEERLPSTFDEMTASAAGEDQTRILRQLRSNGGMMEHSLLLRRNSSKLNAETFKRAVATLKEAKLIEWDAGARTYYLTTEGWG